MKHTKKRHRKRPGAHASRRTPTPAPQARERDLLDEYLAERRPAHPERVRWVIVIALSPATDLRHLLDTGWVGLAPARVADAGVPGVETRGVFRMVEQFVEWMHERGEIGRWVRDRLRHAIDEARYCHFCAPELPSSRGMEERWSEPPRAIGARFAESLTHPLQRELAPRAVQVLAAYLGVQLGPGPGLPFGALDVDTMVAQVLGDMDDAMLEACDLFTILGAFYRWLGDCGHLDPERAREQARAFAKAAMGTQMAFAC